jgi:hypothetical protein
MTRTDKLKAVDAKYLPQLEIGKQAVVDAKTNLTNKEINYEEKYNEYKAKVAAVNEYYDALDMIAKLQALVEPTV